MISSTSGVARRDLFQKKHDAKTPARATASEMRTMTVAAACGAWCMDISDLRLESSCARAGWNLAQDGSENMRAGVVLPSSRAQSTLAMISFLPPLLHRKQDSVCL